MIAEDTNDAPEPTGEGEGRADLPANQEHIQRLCGNYDGNQVWLMDYHQVERRANWSLRKFDAIRDVPEQTRQLMLWGDFTHYLYYGNHALGRISSPRKLRFIKRDP